VHEVLATKTAVAVSAAAVFILCEVKGDQLSRCSKREQISATLR
jgi:hypothetical protein